MKKIQLSKLTSLLSLLFFGLALWLLRRELHDFRYRDIINFFHNLPADTYTLTVQESGYVTGTSANLAVTASTTANSPASPTVPDSPSDIDTPSSAATSVRGRFVTT